MKIGLCMIVKNEAHIVHEALQCTLPLISTYCIVDTGSTDNTIEIIKKFYDSKNIQGTVHERPWKNFGHNRSEALALCDGAMDYALIIDADDTIEFPENGLETIQKILDTNPNACNIIIKEGPIEYWRSQIFKCNDNWGYVGVLHEYPSNKKGNNLIAKLPTDIFMTSRRLGGRNLTGDKMKRDIAVLSRGIIDEPDNERYYFYLAQSYRDDGDNLNAIKYYTKRFEMGRWYEEAWFSAFQIGLCYKRMSNFLMFEYWMQKAHEFYPRRGEAMYSLTEYFRQTNQFYKAYHYCQVGLNSNLSKEDVLFVEKFPNNAGFLYEKTVLDHYIFSDKNIGVKDSTNYLLKYSDHVPNIVSNLKFYISPIKSTSTPLNIPLVFGSDFRPTAVSVYDYPHANVRFVNYLPPVNGEYKTKDGSPVVTRNLNYNLETKEYSIIPDSTPLFESSIKGLEDMRVYKFNDKVYYTASNYYEYKQDTISIVHGEYGSNPIAIDSPTNARCEKNWLHVKDNEFIYNWHPLTIGRIIDNKFIITKQIKTPPLFSLFRGSAITEMDDYILALVHFCEYSMNRNYYHCFVKIDKDSYDVTEVSLPFIFKNVGIEYCLSMYKTDCFVTFNDSEPTRVNIDFSSIQWISLVPNTITRRMKGANVYWAGKYSICAPRRTIEDIVFNTIADKPLDIIFTQDDGIFSRYEYNEILKTTTETRIVISSESSYNSLNGRSIICALSTRGYSNNNVLLLPLDDDTCKLGLSHIFPSMPDWDSRKSIAFWRGNLGGYERPSVRENIVMKLHGNVHSDVKFAFFGYNGTYSENIDKKFIGDRCEMDKFLEYKYLLIIDGTCIASNLQWVFGSGSVPVLITHPKNDWWFKSYVKDMENCIMINYNLSNLEEKIEWLVQNDDKAKEIAINATTLAQKIFTPQFQKAYIRSRIAEILSFDGKEQNLLEREYQIKCDTPSDINEHLPTLREYASECSTIVECGVRGVTSSYAFACGLIGNAKNSFTLIDNCECNNVYPFLDLCKALNVNATFLQQSDIECPLINTDLLFIDTWHIYGQLKRELAYWHSSVNKYIIMHDTTVDEWYGEALRCRMDVPLASKNSGIPEEEIEKGLWPAIEEFLEEHPEWKIKERFKNNNGLTILMRVETNCTD